MSISSVAQSCVRSFKILLEQLLERNDDGDLGVQLPARAVQDELGRLHVWAGNIGALQASSLDYRLREASQFKQQIARLLQDLRQSLDQCEIHEIYNKVSLTFLLGISIVTGQRAQLNASKDEHDDFDEDFSDTSYSGESENSSSKSTSELEQLFISVSETITSLYKLSIAIRRPTPRDRYTKAAKLTPLDPRYDISHVYEKFRYLKSSRLIEKLGKANARRRDLFRYRARHHEKLASKAEQGELDTGTSFGPRPAPYNELPVERSVAAFPKVPLPDMSEKQSQLASTKATTYVADTERDFDLDIETSKSETSFVTSVADDQATGGRRIPDAPKQSGNGRPFECPYCYTIQTLKSSRQWR